MIEEKFAGKGDAEATLACPDPQIASGTVPLPPDPPEPPQSKCTCYCHKGKAQSEQMGDTSQYNE